MSGPIDYLQTFRYQHVVKNAAQVPTNAGSVVVTVTLPDGTTATPVVTNPGAGLYDFTYTTNQVGRHVFKAVATGGVLGSEVDVWEDVFTAEPSGHMFISVDEASTHLRASEIITSDADREQLRWLCMVASEAVEDDLGRAVTRRTVVETRNGGSGEIHLYVTPVISITSVVENGTTLTGSDYLLHAKWGVLYRGGTLTALTWAWGRQNIVVTYVAGYVNPPRIVRKVALNAVQGMWQTSQQASHPLIDEDVAREFVVASIEGLTPLELRAYNRHRAHGVA